MAKCKCNKCKKEFSDKQTKPKNMSRWEMDIEYVCPYCESGNWNYLETKFSFTNPTA